MSNATLQITAKQVNDIQTYISRFLDGVEPPLDISFSENHWLIESDTYPVYHFSVIPTKEELSRLVSDVAAETPTSFAPIWGAYLTYLVAKTIPDAFRAQGILVEKTEEISKGEIHEY